MGPLRGQGRFSSLEDEEGFLWMLETLQAQPHAVRPTPASPLEHVLRTYESAQITGEAVARKLEASPARHFAFPDTALGEQLRTAARLLDAGVEVSVLKVVQEGYAAQAPPSISPAPKRPNSSAANGARNCPARPGLSEEFWQAQEFACLG